MFSRRQIEMLVKSSFLGLAGVVLAGSAALAEESLLGQSNTGSSLPRGDSSSRVRPVVVAPVAPPAQALQPVVNGLNNWKPAPASVSSSPATTDTTGSGYARVTLGSEAQGKINRTSREIAEIEQQLFRALQAREAARHNHTYTGLKQEADRYHAAHEEIKQLQLKRLELMHALGTQILADQPQQRAKVKEMWEKAKANHQATFGLNNSKYVNGDYRTTPHDPKEIGVWLSDPNYQYRGPNR